MTAELHIGDCMTVVGRLPADSCGLIYLDPPFFTKKRHLMVTRSRDQSFSFDDLWSSMTEYGNFLLDRVKQFHRVLSDQGSIFFHCDRTASHIARAVLDAVFGEKSFRSEIIWHYRRWSNAQRGLLPQHQTILWYSKTDSYVFNPTYEAYSPSTNVDQLLARRERDGHGKSVYARDEHGRVVPSGAKQGVPMGDGGSKPFLFTATKGSMRSSPVTMARVTRSCESSAITRRSPRRSGPCSVRPPGKRPHASSWW